jgi:hypothetical protein
VLCSKLWIVMPLDRDRDLDLNLPRTALLAGDPAAARWARDCAWVPGTGYCRNNPCSELCLLYPQRQAEARCVAVARRKRRPSAARAKRRGGRVSAFLLLLQLCGFALA